MSKTRKVASIAFTGAAVAGAAGFAATPAFAASNYHIKNGGTGYTGPFKAHASNTVLVDTTHAATLKCTNATTSGNIPASSPAGPKVASVSAANFSHCSLLGVTFNAHLNKSTSLNATGQTTPNNSKSGVTTGWIGNAAKSPKAISAALSGACTATIIGGSVPAKYLNANHSLSVNSPNGTTHAATLTITNPVGCPIIANGDKAYFAGNYKVTTPAALTISGG